MCLFAGASVRETALSSKNGKLRSEKDVWMDFRTGVQFPSPPPILGLYLVDIVLFLCNYILYIVYKEIDPHNG